MRRLKALMRKEFTHMRHDPRTLIFIFVMPVQQLLLLGYATNTDIKNVPTVVFDQDNSKSSRSLLDAYRVTSYFDFNYLAYSQNDVYLAIDGGKARVGIIIPPGYGNDLATGKKLSNLDLIHS